jgi:NADH:ubiquinone oxidoreductase subunit E
MNYKEKKEKIENILHKFAFDKNTDAAVIAILDIINSEVKSQTNNNINKISDYIQTITKEEMYGKQNPEYIQDINQQIQFIKTFVQGAKNY